MLTNDTKTRQRKEERKKRESIANGGSLEEKRSVREMRV